MDLGNIVGELAGAWARYAQPAGFQIPGTDVTIEGDLPLIDIGTAKKKKRRRRKRLLTECDFKDLACLKTLTGNNDAFKCAVIKAVRR